MKNTLHQALRAISGSIALLTIFAAAADDKQCQMTLSESTVKYGVFNQNEMAPASTEYKGAQYQWRSAPQREVQLTVSCAQPATMRLYFKDYGSTKKYFTYGNNGGIFLEVKNTRVDNHNTNVELLKPGQRQSGQIANQQQKIEPGEGIRFTTSGTQATTTLVLKTALSEKAFKARDQMDIVGQIAIRLETD